MTTSVTTLPSVSCRAFAFHQEGHVIGGILREVDGLLQLPQPNEFFVSDANEAPTFHRLATESLEDCAVVGDVKVLPIVILEVLEFLTPASPPRSCPPSASRKFVQGTSASGIIERFVGHQRPTHEGGTKLEESFAKTFCVRHRDADLAVTVGSIDDGLSEPKDFRLSAFGPNRLNLNHPVEHLESGVPTVSDVDVEFCPEVENFTRWCDHAKPIGFVGSMDSDIAASDTHHAA